MTGLFLASAKRKQQFASCIYFYIFISLYLSPMSSLIQFVASYDDLSTDKSFQFKFYCDKCRNGYVSRF